MSAAGFAVALGIIAIVTITLLVLVLVWAEREPLDEPTEHGGHEP